jgi:hypothetical protein
MKDFACGMECAAGALISCVISLIVDFPTDADKRGVRQNPSHRQQKPKHHSDDSDAKECQERIACGTGIIVPGLPPGSALSADRDLDLVIGHGPGPFAGKEPRDWGSPRLSLPSGEW